MRIDKFLVENGLCSRKEASIFAKKGKVHLNGNPIKDVSQHIDENNDVITFCGEEIRYQEFIIIMLNKPAGYVSATEDTLNPYVCELLNERLQKIGLFPVGRLDKDTVGLMILTNNGPLAHNLLSPKHHVEKTYYLELDHPLIKDAEERIAKGLKVDGGLICKPSTLSMSEDRIKGTIVLTEGKYHEIKRMMETLANKITYLKRVEFGGIKLDDSLKEGEYRYLNPCEIEILEKAK